MDGMRAVVTGGAGGIGAAITAALVRHGARVVVMGRDEDRLQSLREALGPSAVDAVRLDLADPASIPSAFEVAAATGPVDILVNNAGDACSAPFMRTSLELWQHLLNVNLTGAFLCTQQVLPGMVARGYGRIINIASTAALRGYPYVAAYCAAKHGLLGMTRALALEVAKKGVTVNAVCPGFTDTPMVERAVENIVAATGRSADDARQQLAEANPMGRLVRPEEVSQAVVWLAQRASSAVTGQAIAVAGGEAM
jgi:NAD(P)-dependent dehydrogenase (short-subunit alcohol dehydrogenase family)